MYLKGPDGSTSKELTEEAEIFSINSMILLL